MFITLEGIEGSGKTTQLAPIAGFLEGLGRSVTLTREPGATSIGRKIRTILLDPENREIAPLTELLLYGADRIQHLSQVVLPALEAGEVVVCDRFMDATTVYQGAARGLDAHLIASVHRIVVGELCPDLTILFDCPPDVGLARTRRALESGLRNLSETRFENEELVFHEKVRKGYLDLARENPRRFFVVDAAKESDAVFKDISMELYRRLK